MSFVSLDGESTHHLFLNCRQRVGLICLDYSTYPHAFPTTLKTSDMKCLRAGGWKVKLNSLEVYSFLLIASLVRKKSKSFPQQKKFIDSFWITSITWPHIVVPFINLSCFKPPWVDLVRIRVRRFGWWLSLMFLYRLPSLGNYEFSLIILDLSLFLYIGSDFFCRDYFLCLCVYIHTHLYMVRN